MHMSRTVTIAILVKDKETILSEYLHCIYNQTYPKLCTNIYIRTNDNSDRSAEILSKFVSDHRDEYKEIFYDDSSIDDTLKSYKNHDWNVHRFIILGKIRQDSINWAMQHNSLYFVVDVDNFIIPNTLSELVSLNLSVVSPMLLSNSSYSNYHAATDPNGYYAHCDEYLLIYNKKIKGIFQVPVVHCTYLIREDVLDKISYNDLSYRYEYVIFSDTLRKNNISQYIDNRFDYGIITFWTSTEQKYKEITEHQHFLKFFMEYVYHDNKKDR